MRRALFSSLLVASAACVRHPEPAPLAPPARAHDAAPADAGLALEAIPDAAPHVAIPEGPPRWKSVPREQNGFYAVLDGMCSQLRAGRVGKDVVVHYGGNDGEVGTGKRIGRSSFIGLRESGLESIGDPRIESPTGIAGTSLDDFWVADSTGTRTTRGSILYRRFDGKWKMYSKDQTRLHAWLDGGIIGTLNAPQDGALWVEGSSTKPPESLHADLTMPVLSAFPSGEVLVISRKGWKDAANAPMVARHWAPGKKVTEYALDALLPGEDTEWPEVLEIAPDEVYVARGSHVARWNGSSFHALAKTNHDEKIVMAGRAVVPSAYGLAEKVALLRRAAADDLWVLTEKEHLQRLTVTSATTIATPEPVVDVDGVGRGDAWIVGKSGKLYRRDGEGWKAAALPAPAFSAGATLKAKQVVVIAPDDVLLTAMYWEKGPGWKEPELHTALFRTKPVKETLRCNEPDPENNNIHLGSGFQSWPPMATAECKTPFAVLARRSKAIRSDDDWPRIRAALKGHPELGEVSLVEFISGDRSFVGAKGKDLDAARKIAALAAQRDRLRPEVVCGDPEPKRTLAVDLVTGVATIK